MPQGTLKEALEMIKQHNQLYHLYSTNKQKYQNAWIKIVNNIQWSLESFGTSFQDLDLIPEDSSSRFQALLIFAKINFRQNFQPLLIFSLSIYIFHYKVLVCILHNAYA